MTVCSKYAVDCSRAVAFIVLWEARRVSPTLITLSLLGWDQGTTGSWWGEKQLSSGLIQTLIGYLKKNNTWSISVQTTLSTRTLANFPQSPDYGVSKEGSFCMSQLTGNEHAWRVISAFSRVLHTQVKHDDDICILSDSVRKQTETESLSLTKPKRR